LLYCVRNDILIYLFGGRKTHTIGLVKITVHPFDIESFCHCDPSTDGEAISPPQFSEQAVRKRGEVRGIIQPVTESQRVKKEEVERRVSIFLERWNPLLCGDGRKKIT